MSKISILSSLFTAEEKMRIASVVSEVEMSTSGEIVTVVVPSSCTYPGARWRTSVTVSFLVALGLYGLNPSLNPILYLLIQFPALLLGLAVANVPGILRLFLIERQMAQQVHRRALEAFYSNNLSHTRDRTGILIFISILEHRADILVDQGIHAQVKAGSWDEIIRQLLSQIRDNKLVDGICHAVRESGKILIQHFPKKIGDQNQLANQVIFED
jgi:putative membrane protein